MVNPIPEKVANYNVYNEGEKLVGVSGEVTLPSLEALSEEISGAGMLGSYESPTPGHFGSITIEIPFRVLYEETFKMMKPGGQTITLRAAQQSYDVAGGELQHRGLKIIFKVIPKAINLGSLGVGKPTESSNTLEVLYVKIIHDDTTLLELDKLNFVYIVNGEDILEDVREQI